MKTGSGMRRTQPTCGPSARDTNNKDLDQIIHILLSLEVNGRLGIVVIQSTLNTQSSTSLDCSAVLLFSDIVRRGVVCRGVVVMVVDVWCAAICWVERRLLFQYVCAHMCVCMYVCVYVCVCKYIFLFFFLSQLCDVCMHAPFTHCMCLGVCVTFTKLD